MKKILYLSIFLLSILMISCKPDPIDNGDDDTNNTDTIHEEPLVRKYLVREYRYGGDKPVFIIDWNEDFTKIEHITTDSGTYNQLEYDFDYYGEDSMKVSVYEPGHISPTNYVCYLEDRRITRINFYHREEYQYSVYRTYDKNGKIMSESNNTNNLESRFVWQDDNLYMRYIHPNGDTIIYDNFGEHIHPYYTQPHWLPGYAGDAGYSYGYITKPFWKNFGTCSERGCYEYDADGYVTYSYHITEEGEHVPHARYEYDH